MSGTSVATAVVTGFLAQAWSAHPHVNGTEIRAAVARLTPRDRPVPPIIPSDDLLAALDRADAAPIVLTSLAESGGRTSYVKLQGGTPMNEGDGLQRTLSRNATSTQLVF
ncbi:MAG: hypothetical protein USCAAHI_00876 [Beijerinckiaceae bacterium]|nr:MAG: hypothetical protein USCAAHI_00876 [Beijerinckiaceae bacterium]